MEFGRIRTSPWLGRAMIYLAVMLALCSLLLPGGGNTGPSRHHAATIKTQSAADRRMQEGGVRGIDVSQWQGSINWSKVAQDNVKFSFIRASIGMEADKKFVSNAQSAHQNGIKVGAYHYAKFKDEASMKQEARFFLQQLGEVEITYPVVLDVEAHRGLSKTKLTNLCREFMDILKAGGYNVMFYSYQSFLDRYIAKDKLGYEIWAANYLQEPTGIEHAVWQHTSHGSVKGIQGRVDINIASRDLAPRKAITVDGAISRSVKLHLNEAYGAGLNMDGAINMKEIGRAIREGFQMELVDRSDSLYLEVDGSPGELEADLLCTLPLGEATGDPIITLLQCRLFYRGNYTQPLNGLFDDHTEAAVRAFQEDRGLHPTGRLDYETWCEVLIF